MSTGADEELESEIDEVLVNMTNVCDDCEHPKCLAQLKAGRKRIMHLIKSREERLVREAQEEQIMQDFLSLVAWDDPDLTENILIDWRMSQLAALKEGE